MLRQPRTLHALHAVKNATPVRPSDRPLPPQALFDLEATNSELKNDLRDLYITSAQEIDVSSSRKAIVIHVSPVAGDCGTLWHGATHNDQQRCSGKRRPLISSVCREHCTSTCQAAVAGRAVHASLARTPRQLLPLIRWLHIRSLCVVTDLSSVIDVCASLPCVFAG